MINTEETLEKNKKKSNINYKWLFRRKPFRLIEEGDVNKKLFFWMTALGFILILVLGPVSNAVERDIRREKPTNCQKACNEWFKMQHREALANLKSCLEKAKTEEEKEACKEAYRTTMQEARKSLKEKKRECVSCVHKAITNFKVGKKRARAAFKTCMKAAETREAKKACKDIFKEAIKKLKENFREELKACFDSV